MLNNFCNQLLQRTTPFSHGIRPGFYRRLSCLKIRPKSVLHAQCQTTTPSFPMEKGPKKSFIVLGLFVPQKKKKACRQSRCLFHGSSLLAASFMTFIGASQASAPSLLPLMPWMALQPSAFSTWRRGRFWEPQTRVGFPWALNEKRSSWVNMYLMVFPCVFLQLKCVLAFLWALPFKPVAKGNYLGVSS